MVSPTYDLLKGEIDPNVVLDDFFSEDEEMFDDPYDPDYGREDRYLFEDDYE